MTNGITEADLREWTSAWWLVLLVGVLSVIAGVIVLTKPSDSLATLAVIIGIFILVDGIFELAASLSRRTANRGMYTDFCGFYCVCKPAVNISGPLSP